MYNNQYQTQMNMQVPVQNNLALVKSYFRRKSVLAAGILLILLVAAEIASVFTAVPAVKNALDSPELFSSYQDPTQIFNAIQSALTNASYVTSFITLAIYVLFIAAFFIIYFKSKNPLPTANPRAGFSILHVFSIIYLVLICFISVIVLFALLIITFAAIFEGSSSYNSNFTVNGQPYYGNPMPFIILAFLICAAVIALLLVWSISSVRFLGSVKRTIDGPQLVVKGAKTFGVLNIVFGILSCFGAVSTLLTSSVMAPLSSLMPNAAQSLFSATLWITFACMAISSAFIILIGVICIGYDKFMKETIASAVPVMPAAFQQPQGGAAVPPTGNPYVGNQANPFQQHPAGPYTQGSPFPAAQQAKPEEPALQKEEADAETTSTSDHADAPKSEPLCPGCGKEVRQNDAFCEHCGYKLK